VDWATAPYTFQLMSGLSWGPTVADGFLVFSLLMLMIEFINSARYGKSLVEHFLGLCLVGGAGAEFVMVPQTGNSTFMLFVAICVVDLLAGFAASLRRARRTAVVEQAPAVVTSAPVRPPEPVRAEPVRVEPVRTEAPHPDPVAEPRANPFIRVEPAEKIP
jgi:hypothetical protein